MKQYVKVTMFQIMTKVQNATNVLLQRCSRALDWQLRNGPIETHHNKPEWAVTDK